MQTLLEVRINQVKTLHDMCNSNGINPPFTISEFESGLDQMRTDGSSESDLNRFVLHHHKLVHELLYAPPRRT